MATQDDLTRMLLETIHVLASTNLLELVPVDALAWYEQQELEAELEQEMDKTEVVKFIEAQARRWEEIQRKQKEPVAPKCEAQFPS